LLRFAVGLNVGVPLRAVTFDFWNTIAQVPDGAMTAARRQAVADACEEGGLPVDAALLDASLDEVRLAWESSWAEGVHLHPEEGAEMLVRALGAEEVGGERIAAAFLGAIDEVELELAPGIGEALGGLGQRGLRIGIVCDVGFSGGPALRGLLDREGLLDHFDGWSFSDETGHYKPAPEAFAPALAALGAPPQAAMHVGDLRRTDIAGAAAIGMTTVRYRGMNDDAEAGAEADFVIDRHLELLEVVDRLSRSPA
jgi:FMN phosphatase YigB (HAD superfamily)